MNIGFLSFMLMRKSVLSFLLVFLFCAARAADYPLGDYVELEDSKPVDVAAWNALPVGIHFTWASKDVRYSYKNVPDVPFCNDTVLYAWRGERVSALALIYSADADFDVSLSFSDFAGDGGRISGSATASFVNYVMTDGLNADGKGSCGERPDHSLYDSSMVADVIDIAVKKSLKPRRVRPVWCTVEVPRDMLPGDYTATLSLLKEGVPVSDLSISLRVIERCLPAPHDYAFHVDVWQQPYSVSRYYQVPVWSDAHFEAMRPMMEALARAGQKSISAEIIYEPWGDQSHDKFEPMIETVLKSDGSWEYDYTVFDRWVEFMMGCGIDREIKCFSMVPWDMSFRYFDEATGAYKMLHAPTDSPEYADFWRPLLESFAAHLKEKGWYDITTICMDERGLDAMLDAYNLLQDVLPGMKMSLAGVYHPELVDKLHYYCVDFGEPFPPEEIEQRRAEGRITTLYACCSTGVPNAYTFSQPAESAVLPLNALQRGFDGFLRWAYNNWGEDPLRDSRYRLWGAGDSFLIYPGFRSSVRFERFVEGVQCVEKIRILKDEFAAAGDTDGVAAINELLDAFARENITADGSAVSVNRLQAFLNGVPCSAKR